MVRYDMYNNQPITINITNFASICEDILHYPFIIASTKRINSQVKIIPKRNPVKKGNWPFYDMKISSLYDSYHHNKDENNYSIGEVKWLLSRLTKNISTGKSNIDILCDMNQSISAFQKENYIPLQPLQFSYLENKKQWNFH